MILLLFDPHKLDISDEFKEVLGSLKARRRKKRKEEEEEKVVF